MKRFIWLIIIVAISGYMVNSSLENKARKEAERTNEKKFENDTRIAVSGLVQRTNAANDWEAVLSKGDGYRSEPILTIELEQVWQQQRPILFNGSIKDITTYDETRYVVLFERSLFSSLDYMFSIELQLSLLASKSKIDSFLNEHPNLFKDSSINDGIAVVAQISSIKTSYYSGEEGGQWEVKIGEGELLDMIFTGSVSF